jgi:NAD-dependent deacetylase
VLVVVGTSAEVYPAASIPEAARDAGRLVAEVNLAPTVLTGDIADLSVFGRAGEVLPKLAARVRELARK